MDIVSPDEMLSSMRGELLNSLEVFTISGRKDKTPLYKIGIKPPRAILYRNTELFAQEIPPPLKPKQCECKYLCYGSPAVYKCYSCTIYETSPTGYYCTKCFQARHPWYRVPHIFATIDKDEDPAYSAKQVNQSAEVVRYEEQMKDLTDRAYSNRVFLSVMGSADIPAVETKLRSAWQRNIDVEARLRNLRFQLRAGIEDPRDALKKDGFKNESAVAVQRVFRGYVTRRVVSAMYLDRIVRIFDEAAGADYYHDKKTQASSWSPPALLLKKDINNLPRYSAAAPAKIWCLKRQCLRKVPLCMRMFTKRRVRPVEGVMLALKVLHSFARCILARQLVMDTAMQRYRRVWDDEFANHFYADIITGETMWIKPTFFLNSEPSILAE